jgi:RsiW-degrading membrane proteinase PrsW (M82 family)
MPAFRHKIIAHSRDRNFLLRWALIIGVAGIVIGYAVSHFGPARGRLSASYDPTTGILSDESPFKGHPDKAPISPIGDAPGPETLEQVAAILRVHPEIGEKLLKPLNSETRQIFQLFLTGLTEQGDAYTEARDKLAAATGEKPPPRFANEFYAHLLKKEQEFRPAADHFRQEVLNFPRSDYAHRAEIDCLLQIGDTETVDQRLDGESYVKAFDYDQHRHKHMSALVKTGRWWELTVRSNAGFFRHTKMAWVLVTLFAGFVWFLVIGLLGGLEEKLKARAILYGCAFVLGLASAYFVMPAIYFQSEVIGLNDNGEFINDAVFYLSGVGLREEGFKLLLFTPLLPVLLRRRSSMEALAAAGCVGLGFAVNENFGYTGTASEGALFGRLVTANFLHVALTGILGLALFHFVRWPKTRWEEFLATFVGIIAAHAFYDLFLGGYWSQWAAGLPPIIIMAVLVQRYISTAREIREGRQPSLSPLGVFVIGGSLVVALSWIHACWHMPLSLVMVSVGASALMTGVICFIFINALRSE